MASFSPMGDSNFKKRMEGSTVEEIKALLAGRYPLNPRKRAIALEVLSSKEKKEKTRQSSSKCIYRAIMMTAAIVMAIVGVMALLKN